MPQQVALLSTDNKTDIVEIARCLDRAGFLLVSSGGTRTAIVDVSDLEVVNVSDWTGFPPIHNHRLVTYSAPVGSGLLADLANPTHLAEQAEHGFTPIHFVYFGLYDYAERLKKQGVSWETIIENIDVGGPTALTAAAKGARYVVTNPGEALNAAMMLAEGVTPTGRTLQVMQRNAVAAAQLHYTLVVNAMDEFLAAEDAADRAAA
jgi:phosphoribosylaminoimidazolecarboxamide formyltransferase / IMP cyclohydrolase